MNHVTHPLTSADRWQMISAKMASLGLLKIKVFWNKGHDIIISVYEVTNKNLSRDLNYIADVVMWPKLTKFSNSSISMWDVSKPQFYKDLMCGLGSGSVIWDWH